MRLTASLLVALTALVATAPADAAPEGQMTWAAYEDVKLKGK